MWLLDEELRIEVESLPFMTSLELFLHALGEAKGLLKEELTLFLSKEATPGLRKEGLYLSSYPF